METIVVKFGGSSLASAGQFRKVEEIIRANPERRIVVASAPGKRDSSDTKVTDMLYACYDKASAGEDFEPVLSQIADRYLEIRDELGIEFDVDGEIAVVREHLRNGPQRDYMASRGEYLNAKLLAAYLGFAFLDTADYIRFFADGSFDSEYTNERLGAALAGLDYVVLPGFYGALPDGTIRTFSRGGSDITGSVAARAVQADLYENWTDVSGMLAADPRVVPEPRTIDFITYKELRELSYMGASVLHQDAVFPVQRAGIPINIRNTNDPQASGTMILPVMPDGHQGQIVTGIAGRTGFSTILVEKAMMNGEIGFGAMLLNILADHGVSFEHAPSGIDTMSVIVNTEQFAPVRDDVLVEIQHRLAPDALNVEDDLALIAVVGRGMVRVKGVAARTLRAVSDAGINIRMIDQGSDELNIILGVSAEDCNEAIRSIYSVLIG